ncbi:metallophosphoesterase family protein [Paenibacillus sp. L3-i20]|uniref:metallophosphoesterase family protein n=1 Tax=Paenibacillus sp. L3-i20 TaxID=2905833 RepID=UPI001EDEDC77|nr:metallophosphoesterase family protein [Paenibacillus sp. L3-i20]GKU78593.1 phosphohydrolase [Paenibacillus sp. L3-i20]
MDKPLRFRDDGSFTIVQFTDLHWQNGDELDIRTHDLMERVVREEAPDLIVFTGDIIYSTKCDDPIRSLKDAVAVAERSRIPWAAVLGNHDAEVQITREEMLTVLQSFESSETGHTPGLHGWGNYTIEVHGHKGLAAALYFLDSGCYSKHTHIKGYDWISRDQIDWYSQKSKAFQDRNGGTPLPSLAFFHIPLPEYVDAWEQGDVMGNKHERVCCSEINSGFFAAMAERRDVLGTFVGHDHINDYCGVLHDIKLCYGRATGYNTYGKEGFPHGARVIRLKEGERTFESWLRLEDGSVDFQQKLKNESSI